MPEKNALTIIPASAASSNAIIPTSAASSNAIIPTADDKPKPGLYLSIQHTKKTTSETGGFDFYILKQCGDVVKILQPSGKEQLIKEGEREGLMESFKNQYSATNKEDGTDKTTTTTINSKLLLTAEEVTDEKMNTIKAVHNCFGGHNLETCGFTTLVTSLALLGETVVAENRNVTIKIPNFKGAIKLEKLNNVNNPIDTDRAIDSQNRKVFADWLVENKEILKESSLTLFVEQGEEANRKEVPYDRIIRISKQDTIRGYAEYLAYGEVLAIYDAVLAQKLKTEAEKGGDKLKKELEGQQDKLQEYGIKINWDNITVDDLAILALLSAFLAVISGPGALAIPVAIAAFRAIAIEKGLNLEGKVDFSTTATPGTSPSGSGAETATKPKVLDASPLAVG